MTSIYENQVTRDCAGWTITSPLVAGLPSIEPRKPFTASDVLALRAPVQREDQRNAMSVGSVVGFTNVPATVVKL